MAGSPYDDELAAVLVDQHSVEIAGSRTSYWVYGEPKDPAQPTIVLVHGFRGDHHGLEPIVSQLAGQIMIIPDLPGFGTSTPFATTPHDVDSYARWLNAFVPHVSPDQDVILLGHSFGSIIVAAALAGGLQVKKAILVNPIGAAALEGPRGILTRLASLYYRLGAALPERLGFALLRSRLIVRGLSIIMAKATQPGLRRWIHQQHDGYFSAFANRQVVLEAFQASVSNDVSQYATRISTSTLLIVADKDDITPIASQQRLQTLFPDADLVMIADVGHLIHYEAPDQAADAIRTFLDEGPS